MAKQRAKQIVQPEGLCFMQYKCEKCQKQDRIWNSRPRVTPFIISCSNEKCDGFMKHISWGSDIYAPNHKPQKGERIFVDFAEEAAEKFYKKQIEEDWEESHSSVMMKNAFGTKELALKHCMKNWYFGQPHIITITKEIA